MDEEKLLQSAVKWQRRARKTSEMLGGKTAEFLKKNKSRFDKNAEIIEAWGRLLPEGLLEECQVEEISGGVLKIAASPGVYIHELKLIKDELLKHLQRECPKSGIKKITLVVK